MKKINGYLTDVKNEDIILLEQKPEEFWKDVTNIGKSAFYNCIKLKNICIPDQILSIGYWAFSNCSNLTTVVLSKNVKEISFSAFSNCTNLTTLITHNNLIKIESFAFAGCSKLELKIPESVKIIDDKAFIDVPKVIINKKNICGDLLTSELFDYINSNPNVNLKLLSNIYQFMKTNSSQKINQYSLNEYVNFCVNMGMLEPVTTTIAHGKLKNGQPNLVSVSNLVYTFMQGLIKQNQIQLDGIYLHGMKLQGYNEAFAKYIINKNNWIDIINNENVLLNLSKIYAWFKQRMNLDFNQYYNDNMLPKEEKNRFKVMVYEKAENGNDKIYWRTPTIDYFLSEQVRRKFNGIETKSDEEIAKTLSAFGVHSQKHFEKAKEINHERIKLNTQNILKKSIKEETDLSLDNYRQQTKNIKQRILEESADILSTQLKNTESLFSYETLSKDSTENYVMGFFTNCCVTLYGAGGDAMRAMIIHPDLQPLVIRDVEHDNKIIAFGIIYVNRKEGYAVVNSFETNICLENNYDKQKIIYKKAMELVNQFVNEYNKENPTVKIKKVNCGLSTNGEAINQFIKKHKQSSTKLKAINFAEYKYSGNFQLHGDWFQEQYEIYNQENEDTRVK